MVASHAVAKDATSKPGVPDPPRPLVGIQIAAHSFFDEGIDHCLDLLKESAGVNALLVSGHSYYGAMGRPKHLMADHGVPKPDNSKRSLPRVWVKHHEKYFTDTTLRHRSPDPKAAHAGREILAELAEPASKRGMKVYAREYQPSGRGVARWISGWETVLAVDHRGQPFERPCWNHPDYRGYLLGTLRDMLETYPLDGLQYGAESPGPMSKVIFKGHGMVCFCDHCQNRGKRVGINVERAREGGKRLHEFCQALRGGKARTPDGVLAELLAILLKFPEILQWERLWHESAAEVHQQLYDTVKAIRPHADVGRHVDHRQSSWDPIYRAASRYQDMPPHADFVKPILYHDILGPRLKSNYLDALQATVLKELSLRQSLDLFYALFGHNAEIEPKLEDLAEKGFSPEYVYRETRRAVDGVGNRAAVYSGIGLDIPKGGGWGTQPWPSDPAEVYQAVRRAFDAGAQGVVASREYEEITVGSLETLGRATRDAHQAVRRGGPANTS